MSKYLIIGKNGQVGRALNNKIGDDTADYFGRNELDLTDIKNIYPKLEKYSNDNVKIIINAAAYTAVDKAEDEYEVADLVNHLAVKEIARFCDDHDVILIHYSTDYVFDGTGHQAWLPHDKTNPINKYGLSKLHGEQAIEKLCKKYLIFRTSWVYDATGSNFVNTIIRLLQEKPELSIIADQKGLPSYAGDIATATLSAIDGITNNINKINNFPSGIYHLTGSGKPISWYDFANNIFELTKQYSKLNLKTDKIIPISSTEYITKATRPTNSWLDCSKTYDILNARMPDWQISLDKMLKQKFYSVNA